MIDVIIVDDEPAGRRSLRECCALEADLRIVGEYGDGATALEAIQRQSPDLLFLDIQMDTMTGLELARALEPTTLPLIVFVTAYDDYAIEAFEVSAIDYLLKPFDEERFQATLGRVRRRISEPADAAERHAALDALIARLERSFQGLAPASTRLLAESGGRMKVLDTANIEVVEADRNYVVLRVGRDAFHARSTMQQAEDSLRGQPMLRISRSCLVNLSHLREVSRTPRGDFILVVSGGTTVTSSEGFRDKVRAELEQLKLGGSGTPADAE
jgi:two-component system LytT family response regulator